jgi:hypothetical protein
MYTMVKLLKLHVIDKDYVINVMVLAVPMQLQYKLVQLVKVEVCEQ